MFSPDSLEEAEPLELDGTIHLEEDQDEVPFSMEDLLSSFETNMIVSDEELSIEPKALPIDQLEEDEAVHLVDDPALWPSISKLQEIAEPDLQDLDEGDRSIS